MPTSTTRRAGLRAARLCSFPSRSVLAFLMLFVSVAAQERKVICYVSHDFEHAEAILKAFEAETGIKIEPVGDTEDSKTVGLANRLVEEKDKPRADVFWNNEVTQAVRLKSMRILEPYVSPNAATIPTQFKDPEGYWTGFAARARVLIYNTNLVKPENLPKRFADLADPRFKGMALVSRPLTGTSLTNAGVLVARDGFDATRALFERFSANDVQWEKGNAYVMQQVADGVRPFGMTDTDDAYVSESKGAPTKSVYLDQGAEDVGALLIPNAVMLIKGAPHPAEARALIDYLLRPETEAALAAGRAAQIPLHPGVARPAHVKGADEIKAMTVDWAAAGEATAKRLPDLQKLFERPASADPSSRAAWIGLAAAVTVAIAVGVRRRRREKAAA
jgi:iron(III) transport system substrate-binding protein